MGQCLEGEVPVVRTVAPLAERRERQRVGRVIGEVEPALQSQGGMPCVREPAPCGANQTVDLGSEPPALS